MASSSLPEIYNLINRTKSGHETEVKKSSIEKDNHKKNKIKKKVKIKIKNDRMPSEIASIAFDFSICAAS
jgi:hypothetical protein